MRTSILTRNKGAVVWFMAGLLALAPSARAAATVSRPMPVIPKWGRLELMFKSSVVYTNAVQQAELVVRFAGPSGQTGQVFGFWDGGKVWRARFSPDQAGRWTFRTTCSDVANAGLHEQSGEFICTAGSGQSRFNLHGGVQVARDGRQLAHRDGTPFFWLADTVWNGPRVASVKDWDFYIRARMYQGFTVAQWAVAPGMDAKGRTAFSGRLECIAINPDFFQRLDEKVDLLSWSGILSAITPWLEMEREAATPLPDDQTALLARYVVARWGADPVVWLLAFDGDSVGKKVGRWKRIGQSVFGEGQHAPVVLYPGETPWLLEEFRDQAWVDVLGVQVAPDVTDDALKWTFSGPFPKEWTKEPVRPIIAFTPYEDSVGAQSKQRISARDVRRAAYWGLLMTAPAGVSYGGQGVLDWDVSRAVSKSKSTEPPMWQQALFMPGAKDMWRLGKLAETPGFLRLRPEAGLIGVQPGSTSPQRYIAAARTEAKDLAMVYVPEDRTLEIMVAGLPAAPNVSWFNPRTGFNSPAVAVVGAKTCQFPTPDPGDWVLVMKAGGK